MIRKIIITLRCFQLVKNAFIRFHQENLLELTNKKNNLINHKPNLNYAATFKGIYNPLFLSANRACCIIIK